uniref:DUF5987 family protein n=1 Tax=Nocardia suismassiliense TaxID=2077092 RepID=UPI003F499D52
MTPEAFADTIAPGEQRFPADRAVVGAAEGGGDVAVGAVELLKTPATGLTDLICALLAALNGHSLTYTADTA